MDYIKWLITEKHRDFFETGICIPVFFLNVMVVVFLLALATKIGVFLAIVSLSIWALPIFFFGKESYQRSYNEYLRNRKK